MVEITCPVSKGGKIAGYVVAGIFGQSLLILNFWTCCGTHLGLRP